MYVCIECVVLYYSKLRVSVRVGVCFLYALDVIYYVCMLCKCRHTYIYHHAALTWSDVVAGVWRAGGGPGHQVCGQRGEGLLLDRR